MAMWQQQKRNTGVDHPGGENPIRFELFSIERLAQHAVSLARAQKIISQKEGRKLIPRVHENARILLEAYKAVARAVREQRAITPAAEWLLDNFHVIEEQVGDIFVDLPEAITVSYPSWPKAYLPAIPESMVSLGIGRPHRQPFRPGVADAFCQSLPKYRTPYPR